MKFHRDEKRKVRATVDLTPLIDVVFQLLIFFMLASTFVVNSQLQVEIPTTEGTTELKRSDISITLQYGDTGPGGGGPVYLDDIEINTMEELSRSLEVAYSENPDASVLIRPDRRISAGRLIEVMGILSKLGIHSSNIEAEPLEEGESAN